jgi:hypothetical protein
MHEAGLVGVRCGAAEVDDRTCAVVEHRRACRAFPLLVEVQHGQDVVVLGGEVVDDPCTIGQEMWGDGMVGVYCCTEEKNPSTVSRTQIGPIEELADHTASQAMRCDVVRKPCALEFTDVLVESVCRLNCFLDGKAELETSLL